MEPATTCTESTPYDNARRTTMPAVHARTATDRLLTLMRTAPWSVVPRVFPGFRSGLVNEFEGGRSNSFRPDRLICRNATFDAGK